MKTKKRTMVEEIWRKFFASKYKNRLDRAWENQRAGDKGEKSGDGCQAGEERWWAGRFELLSAGRGFCRCVGRGGWGGVAGEMERRGRRARALGAGEEVEVW